MLTSTRDGCTIGLRVKPGAKQDMVIGPYAGRLKMTVVAPPERGKANQAVARVLAGLLNLGTSRVRVVSGFTTRDKTLLVEGCTPEDVRQRFERMPRMSSGPQRSGRSDTR